MLKSFEFEGFTFDFCLGAYHLRLNGEAVSAKASEMTKILAAKIALEPSGGRQVVMVEALSSIVPEGESVEYTPRGSSVTTTFTSPREVRETLLLGALTECDEELLEFRVVGLRALKRVVSVDRDYNESYPSVDDVWEILLEKLSKEAWEPAPKRLVLRLGTSHGMCGSGYCSATWSHETLLPVRDLGPMTHRAVGDVQLMLAPGGRLKDRFSCEVFGWSGNGSCDYYPTGSAWAKPGEHFESTGRGHGKPLVHVFFGASNLGKSTVGRFVGSEATVYETDQSEVFLPKMAYAQVIVLGGKFPLHSVGAVEAFFMGLELDVELVPVRFGKEV